MCSFLVYTGNDISKKEFEKGLDKIKYRGPDMTKITEEDGIWVISHGFRRKWDATVCRRKKKGCM